MNEQCPWLFTLCAFWLAMLVITFLDRDTPMNDLIQKLKRGVEDWNEQARLWEARGDAELAESCRMKANQWMEVIEMLERG